MDLFELDDWMLFRTLGTIGQKAGVELNHLRRLVLKELADNALDAGANCEVAEIEIGRYVVEDDGPGLPGGPDDVAKLFSIRRPLTSSKRLRLPTRGAVGNGLRVVTGAVLASGGKLTVSTQNRVHHLTPQHDGTTAVEWQEADYPTGTKIEIEFGESLPEDDDALAWARQAIAFGNANVYGGKSSAYWFDADAFHELCQSAGDMTVRELIKRFDGCTGKAGKLAADFQGRRASESSRTETAALLLTLRKASTPVGAKRLKRVGKEKLPGAYASAVGSFVQRAGRGGLCAEIPFIVEAWAMPGERQQLTMAVNRTPIASDLAMYRHSSDKNNYTLYGCGLMTEFPVGQPRRGDFKLTVNLTTPYMPIITDGKTPDLSVVEDELVKALGSAVKKAKRTSKTGKRNDQSAKAFIIQYVDETIREGGGGGACAQRTAYYVLGKIHAAVGAACEMPSWGWFCNVVTDIEAVRGRIPLLYRDDRGAVYHPHTGEYIPLGTRSVERYRRPEWLFHKVMYIEKAGLLDILIDNGWPERNDCALLTSQGQPTRAARDLLDFLGDTGEPLTFYCVHDADAYGTTIYQALTEATKARGARKVEVINLGLEPWEAVAMDLQVEPAKKKKGGGRHPVASYVPDEWAEWLQKWRIELNAMRTPDFMEWLDRKTAEHGGETKLVPPEMVLRRRLTEHARQKIRDRLVAEAVRDARVDKRTEAELESIVAQMKALNGELVHTVRQSLADNPAELWTGPVEAVAERLLAPELKNRPKRRGKSAS